MNWYLEVLKKYIVFDGRARRKEYWYFVLFNIIISVVLSFVDNLIGTVNVDTGAGMIGGVYSLAVLIPGLAVSVRRLHDTGRSGWWLLLIFIPIIGWIALLVFNVQDSQPEANEYGSNPKNVA